MRSLSCIGFDSAEGAEELRSMFMFRKACAVKITMAVAIALTLTTMCTAATKKYTASTGKVYVPSKIVKGASVSKGRVFHSPRLPEDSLAAIKLGRPAKEVLSRWGNPSRITIGTTQSEAAQKTAPVVSGIPYTPPQTNIFGGGLQAGVNQALPSLPGLSAPATAVVAPTVSSGPSIITSEEITWTYDLPSGITLEFIITDGLVTQITVGGQGPWGLSKTRTGLQLGDTYKLVIWVCGYPESQRYAGRFLRASYVNKSRALYTFLDKKLVGITIAMVPEQLKQ